MFRFLFPRLTATPGLGESLFAFATGEARQPHWYVEGGIPDTLDGRFRMLATITALLLVRLEQAGDAGEAASVAVTERFVEVMESEHRELGLGDPKLGRTVRKLVGALSHRVDLWRRFGAGELTLEAAARDSLYRQDAAPRAMQHASEALEDLSRRLAAAPDGELLQGRAG